MSQTFATSKMAKKSVDPTAETVPEGFFDVLEVCEVAAHECCDVSKLKLIADFKVKYYNLLELIVAIARSPRRSIEGEASVSSQLELSKTAIHKRLHSLGLSVDDLRDPDLSIHRLASRSHVLRDSYLKICGRTAPIGNPKAKKPR